MRIELQPTERLVTSNGTLCRIWQGKTDSGIPVEAYVQRIKVPSEMGDRFVAEMGGKVFETDAPKETPRNSLLRHARRGPDRSLETEEGLLTMIDIKGIDKATLLAALVNAARPLGLGRLSDNGQQMTADEAQKWIDDVRSHDASAGAFAHDSPLGFNRPLKFDYVKGRPIKSDIGGDEYDPRLYDRDQGQGAAARVIAKLREDS